jgi:hypothetical protein
MASSLAKWVDSKFTALLLVIFSNSLLETVAVVTNDGRHIVVFFSSFILLFMGF